jgi:hypothetical protein
MKTLHTITCPTLGAALRLSIILEHEGYPTVWFAELDGKIKVHTMANLHAVSQAIGMPNNWEVA